MPKYGEKDDPTMFTKACILMGLSRIPDSSSTLAQVTQSIKAPLGKSLSLFWFLMFSSHIHRCIRLTSVSSSIAFILLYFNIWYVAYKVALTASCIISIHGSYVDFGKL